MKNELLTADNDSNNNVALTGREISPPPLHSQPERLAYSLREAAQLLGISYISAWRLAKRGLIKSSGALRTKIISKAELERFLKS